MKDKFIQAYMDVAERFSKLSSAKRLQVGAIVVKDDRIISIGYNGMPAGWDNICEDVVEVHEDGGIVTKTKPEVIHAEANAIAKLAKGNESGDGSTMFLTHAPCIDCAKQVYTAGVKKVYYQNSYKDTQGIDFLEKCGIEVQKISPGEINISPK
jgi:dCMP deaminase